jgi:diaminopimelate decarboxylase
MDLEALARTYGTPLYVYDAEAILAAVAQYAVAFAALPHRICYALKANSNGAILRMLAEAGLSADIVSGYELLAARRAGFPAGRIYFAGAGKRDGELAQGVSEGIGEFCAESEEEIRRLAAIAAALGHTARVSLRVNPDIDARSHPFISTGLRHSKFGVDINDAIGIFERATRLVGVRLVGVQSHIGSQITDIAPMAAAAEAVASLSRDLLARGFPLETINIGGGLGIDYQGSGTPTPADLAAALVPVLARVPLNVLLEPGRSIVGPAGVLLTRTLYRKQNHGREFVVVDAGVNDLLRPALYGAFHRIEPVQPRGRGTIVADVVGPVCESGDFLARERELEAVEAGDLLVVRDAGAYGFSMSSNYNMRPRAAEVLVRGGRPHLVRRRETFEDLVATELPS